MDAIESLVVCVTRARREVGGFSPGGGFAVRSGGVKLSIERETSRKPTGLGKVLVSGSGLVSNKFLRLLARDTSLPTYPYSSLFGSADGSMPARMEARARSWSSDPMLAAARAALSAAAFSAAAFSAAAASAP